MPAAQDAELFTWLKTLYPDLGALTPEMARVSTQTAMAELLLSGCTTTSDHLYLFPNGVRGWTTRSRRRPRSACASTPRAAR